jgi:hypothetical protein
MRDIRGSAQPSRPGTLLISDPRILSKRVLFVRQCELIVDASGVYIRSEVEGVALTMTPHRGSFFGVVFPAFVFEAKVASFGGKADHFITLSENKWEVTSVQG